MTRKGWLLFIAVSFFWGIPYLFVKIALRELDPSVVVFARVALASVVLLPMGIRRRVLKPLLRAWPALVLFAVIHMAGPYLLITYGEQHVSSSLASLLIAANPLIVALIALLFATHERVNGSRLIGLLIGMIGLVVLLGFDGGGDSQIWMGTLMLLLAAAGYAIGALMLRRSPLMELPGIAVAASVCSISTVLLLPFIVWRLPGKVPGVEVLTSVLILGSVCTALVLPTYFALIAEVGASRGTVVNYVNPGISVLLGMAILREPLTIATIVGFLLIVAGSWLSTTSSTKRKGLA